MQFFFRCPVSCTGSLLETRNKALERQLRNSEVLGAPVESVRDELTVIKLSYKSGDTGFHFKILESHASGRL